MVVVLAIEIFDMERDAGGLGESLEPFLEQFRVHLAEFRFRKADLPDQIGPVRAIQRDPGQRLVHRDQRIAIAADALAVAERAVDRLADRDAGILRGVVVVDMEVADRLQLQIDQRMARQLLHHVIEEADAGIDPVFARPVQVERHVDPGLLGPAGHRCGARRPVGRVDSLVHRYPPAFVASTYHPRGPAGHD